jgi:predicted MFS family arabinose efflux permease
MAGLSIITRIALAKVADRTQRFEKIAILLAVNGMITFVLLLIGTSTPIIVMFILFWSIADTGPALIHPLPLAQAFGSTHFGSILGASSIATTAAMITSPLAAGVIFDGTGSYTWALVMLLGAYLISLAFFYISMRLPRPVDQISVKSVSA